MKTDNLSPWPLIRWGLVLVVYVLTVAIATDMVRRRDKELAQAGITIQEWKKLGSDMKRSTETTQGELVSIRDKVREVSANAIQGQALTETLGKAISTGKLSDQYALVLAQAVGTTRRIKELVRYCPEAGSPLIGQWQTDMQEANSDAERITKEMKRIGDLARAVAASGK